MTTPLTSPTRHLARVLAVISLALASFAGCAGVPTPSAPGTPERIAIASASDLGRLRDAWNRGDFRAAATAPHLVLEKDLDLGAIERWQPIGTRRDPFDGVLDGKGHVISGKLTCELGAGSFELDCGLFGEVQASTRNIDGPLIRDTSLAVEIGVAPEPSDAGVSRSKVAVRLGALAGHANRLRLQEIRIAKGAAVRFDAQTSLPHDWIALSAGGLIGLAERIDAADLSTAGIVEVAAAEVSAGGLFGKLDSSSVHGARLDGALRASGSAELSAGGLAADIFNEMRRNGTPVHIADVSSSMTLDLTGGDKASAGGIASHIVATKSRVERVRVTGDITLTIGDSQVSEEKKKRELGHPFISVGGVAGTLAMAELSDAEVTARLAFKKFLGITGGIAGGIVGHASLTSLQNLAFSGAIENGDGDASSLSIVGGIAGHVSDVSRIANALVQGDLGRNPKKPPRGLVGLSDQRGHFLFCDRWPAPLDAVGAVSREARVHDTSMAFDAAGATSSKENAAHLNAPLEAGDRPQRCLTPGSYLPWKVDETGRAALDFKAAPKAAREFIGSATRGPRDAHWRRRVELSNWETAEVQKRFERIEEGVPPVPSWRDRQNCGPLAAAKMGLPDGSPCLFSEGEQDLTRCDGPRGPRRLRHLRFIFARERLEDFKTRRSRNGIPMGAFLNSDYRSSLQGLAMTAHAFALTPSLGVEAYLRKGQHAFGGESHLTLLAMDRARLDALAARTQLFEQLRHPAQRGAPVLPAEMRGAPKWVYWNCFDALNEQSLGADVAARDGETAGENLRRFPFCGVGRAGDDVELPKGASRKAFAAQEAFDALAEAIESWLNSRFEVRSRIEKQNSDAGEEAWMRTRRQLRALPFTNAELACSVSDLILWNADRILRTERWISADGEVWALAAIDEEAFLDLLARDEGLSENAAEIAAQELAASFADDAERRRGFAGRSSPVTPQEAPSCQELARKHLGWQGDFHCALMPMFGAPPKGSDADARGREIAMQATRLAMLRATIEGELMHPDPKERAAWMNDLKRPDAPISLAELSIANAIGARVRAPMFGTFSPPPQDGAQAKSPRSAPPFSFTLHFAGLDKATLDEALARVSFVDQLGQPALRGNAPTVPEMAGAPAWVRWTCFDALKGEPAGATPKKRHPYCSVAADRPAQKSPKALKSVQRAADAQLATQIAGSVSFQLQKYLHATSNAGAGAPDEYGAMRDDEWQRLKAELDERERARREDLSRVQAARSALEKALGGVKFLHRTWSSRDGEVWALSAIDEASLLRAIRKAKPLGPEFASWFEQKLAAEFVEPVGDERQMSQ